MAKRTLPLISGRDAVGHEEDAVYLTYKAGDFDPK